MQNYTKNRALAFVKAQSTPIRDIDVFTQFSYKNEAHKEESYHDLYEDLYDENSPILVYKDTNGEIFCQSKQSFFEEKQFLIKPMKHEVEQGILIAGHRFIPFYKDSLKIESIKAIASSGKRIAKKRVELDAGELDVFYSLFDELEALEMIDADEDIDGFDYFDGDMVTISVFNMKSFYKDNNFKFGDSIIATVKNWEKKSFEFEVLSSSALMSHAGTISNWCDIMDRNLLLHCEVADKENIPFCSAGSQLANCFFADSFNENFLLSNPVIHVGGYLAHSKKIFLYKEDYDTFFWPHGKETFCDRMMREGLMRSPINDAGSDGPSLVQAIQSVVGDENFDGDIDSLFQYLGEQDEDDSFDSLLQYFGYSTNEAEFEAYVRDEFYTNRKSLDKAIALCLDNRVEIDYPEYKKEFMFHVNVVWNRVQSSYNRFRDEQTGKIRQSALAIHQEHLLWIRSLDQRQIEPDELPEDMIYPLGEATSMLSMAIDTLNHDEDEMSDRDARQFKKTIDEFGNIIRLMMGEIEAVFANK